MCSASANSLNAMLIQSNDPNDVSNRDGYTSNAAVLMVGGAREANNSVANTYKIILKHRRGFVRIALKTGASLVPAISFGENNVFDVTESEPGSKFHNFREIFKRYTGVVIVQFKGRSQWFQGLLPRRNPIVTVIGKSLS